MKLAHHAYYIEDSPALFAAYQDSVRASQRFDPHDPGFVARRYELLGIDEARELQQLASLKKTGGAALYFLSVSSITSEAQQALLKLFEEPQAGVVFVVLIPPGALLPTLRSRMLPYPQASTLRLNTKDSPLYFEEARAFLRSPQKARSAQIGELLEDEEWAKDRVRDFLTGLELVLQKETRRLEVRTGLEDIAKVRSYAGDRSPSFKMLLEHLAVSLPRV